MTGWGEDGIEGWCKERYWWEWDASKDPWGAIVGSGKVLRVLGSGSGVWELLVIGRSGGEERREGLR
eukprot:3941841-Rhodomonas_salina.5